MPVLTSHVSVRSREAPISTHSDIRAKSSSWRGPSLRPPHCQCRCPTRLMVHRRHQVPRGARTGRARLPRRGNRVREGGDQAAEVGTRALPPPRAGRGAGRRRQTGRGVPRTQARAAEEVRDRPHRGEEVGDTDGPDRRTAPQQGHRREGALSGEAGVTKQPDLEPVMSSTERPSSATMSSTHVIR
jgi:hypothetical protein